jgi:hypothetical protein
MGTTRRDKTRGAVAYKAGYLCQAEGLHHDSCPVQSSIWVEGIRGVAWALFDKHHKQKKAWGGKDELENFLWIYELCHLRIHQNETEALRLGLLANAPRGAYLIG